MTIPQIEAVLKRINKHICIKAQLPWKDEETEMEEPKEEHTVDQALQFVAQFNKRR